MSMPTARTDSPLFEQLLAERTAPVRRATTRRAARRHRRAVTPIEQRIAEEKGGSVAQLIYGLLDDETLATRRWPFHKTH